MREIKFRAKETKGDNFIYSNGYYFDGINYWFLLPSKNSALAFTKKVIIDINTLSQFIGIQDINGKDVYEGDILPYGNIVTYVDASDPANLGMEVGYYAQRDNFESWRLLEVGEELDVLGNIYDNPELINK
jgi:uncharacterized phage protein (TIGR01671 family)